MELKSGRGRLHLISQNATVSVVSIEILTRHLFDELESVAIGVDAVRSSRCDEMNSVVLYPNVWLRSSNVSSIIRVFCLETDFKAIYFLYI